jgi:stearoyl-CoA desaturase (delta-9 desaturase)
MAFIDTVLQQPSYGWQNEKGELIVPNTRQLFKEALGRINIFKSRKNWISLAGWFTIACMSPFFYVFVTRYFSWYFLLVALVYSLIIMGTHGTIWFHRYCTHRAYRFSHPIWRILTQHLVIKTLAEEVYVVSHHVHHAKSDQPGDPYNSKAGLLYCFLADVNHQGISKDLSEKDYSKVTQFMRHTGVWINSFKQYSKWGSIASPKYTFVTLLLNWILWYTLLYFLGGHGLACAIFTAAMLWFILVRVFNYTGHAKGKTEHVDGTDFDRSNLSVNQMRPGLFTGEWHNNHHLYPGSARAGFLPHQLDLAWIYIYCLHKIGAVSWYHDSKPDFLRKYINAKKSK